MNGGTAPGWELDSEIICSSLNVCVQGAALVCEALNPLELDNITSSME